MPAAFRSPLTVRNTNLHPSRTGSKYPGFVPYSETEGPAVTDHLGKEGERILCFNNLSFGSTVQRFLNYADRPPDIQNRTAVGFPHWERTPVGLPEANIRRCRAPGQTARCLCPVGARSLNHQEKITGCSRRRVHRQPCACRRRVPGDLPYSSGPLRNAISPFAAMLKFVPVAPLCLPMSATGIGSPESLKDLGLKT